MSRFRPTRLGLRFNFWFTILPAALLLLASPAFGQALQSITVKQIKDKGAGGLPVGTVRQFTAMGHYADGSKKYLTQSVNWTSSDPSVATISSGMGLATAVSPGSVKITATLNGVVGSSNMDVVANKITGVVVTPSTWGMQTGASQQYDATAVFGINAIKTVTSDANWTSSNPSVATVNANGVVTAVAKGTTKIKASYGGKSGTTKLVVAIHSRNVGLWSPPKYLGMIPVHAAMLHSGKVLLFGFPEGRSGGPSPARLFDPTDNSLKDVTLPFSVDIFCAGQSVMPDGRVLVDGGLDDEYYPAHAGITNTTLFDPVSETWSGAAGMNYSRWYPTTLVMPDGTILAVTGTENDGKTIAPQIESYNPANNTWTVLPPSANVPNANEDYVLLTVLKDGRVLYSAPRQDSQIFDPVSQTWSFASSLNFGPRFHTMAVLLPNSQKVMIVGGASDQHGYNPTNTSEVIDFSVQQPAWAFGTPMNVARFNQNLLYLADGTLIVVGGGQLKKYRNPVFNPEIYDPAANTWTLMAPQVGVRAYHSTAVLMPDGRVFSTGSDSLSSFQFTYEIYSPPYLFKGARPSITSAPGDAQYGQQFSVQTPDAADIARVALIRPTATTHANHMDDDRYVDLVFQKKSGSLMVTAPGSANDAPPGYYMLSILNSKGVPAVMPFVKLHP